MKTITFTAIIAAAILLFASCGNDEPDNPIKKKIEPKVIDYYPMKAGNFWVYALYENHPDSSKENEKFIGTDSVYVVGQEIFGTDTFWKVSYNSTFWNKTDDFKYYKDSAGYLIEKPGIKKLSIDNFNDTIFFYTIKGSEGDFLYVRRYMEKYEGTIETPAGLFDSLLNLKQKTTLKKPNLFPDYPRHYNNIYAKGIGRVYFEFGYAHASNITECRLVKYSVK